MDVTTSHKRKWCTQTSCLPTPREEFGWFYCGWLWIFLGGRVLFVFACGLVYTAEKIRTRTDGRRISSACGLQSPDWTKDATSERFLSTIMLRMVPEWEPSRDVWWAFPRQQRLRAPPKSFLRRHSSTRVIARRTFQTSRAVAL